jgi:hypothetical protein
MRLNIAFWGLRRHFELCGARLKELFEKSSLRNFKNFSAVIAFILNKIFRATRGNLPHFLTLHCHLLLQKIADSARRRCR